MRVSPWLWFKRKTKESANPKAAPARARKASKPATVKAAKPEASEKPKRVRLTPEERQERGRARAVETRSKLKKSGLCKDVNGGESFGSNGPADGPKPVDGCACMRYARVGMVPAPMEMMMRCASGARKLVRVQPMVVSGVGDTGPLVVYLFGDAAEESSTGAFRWSAGHASAGGPLTAREMEVLRYIALGWDVPHIATELELSPHTVRNHSTNLRRKLDVTSSLEAVMAALRLVLLTFDDGRGETG